ncbi:MAG: hypothetical protein C0594_16675, partial [Marinilabiliales bacterium]
SFKENFGFGYKVMTSSVISAVFTNAYNLVIGKIYNAEALGFFYQARRLNKFAHSMITKTFREVSLPVLSSLQDNDDKLVKVYLVFLRTISFLAFPLMMMLFVTAKPLIEVIFTSKWSASIPYFQLICIEGLLMPIIALSSNIPLVKGRADLTLRLEVIYKVILVASIAITVYFGIFWMVVGLVVQVVIQALINFAVVSKLIKVGFAEQFFSFIKIALISTFVAFTVFFIQYINFLQIWLLIVQVLSYIVLYIGINLLFNSEELKEILQFIQINIISKLKRKSKVNG